MQTTCCPHRQVVVLQSVYRVHLTDIMADLDLCDQWLHQAWVELKAPLDQAGGAVTLHRLNAQAVQDLLQALCEGQIESARQICQQHQHGDNAGQSDMAHALSLLLPVIELIERDWQADRRSYTDTLYAFWNVQRLLQGWSQPQATPARASPSPQAHVARVLIASAPGCQHHLGSLVVADLFRSRGWHVQTLIDASAAQLIEAVQHECPDVVGLSVGHDAGLQGLADLLRSIRQAGAGTPPRILVGGNIFTPNASAFEWLGADGIATSAQHALVLAGHWVQHKHH